MKNKKITLSLLILVFVIFTFTQKSYAQFGYFSEEDFLTSPEFSLSKGYFFNQPDTIHYFDSRLEKYHFRGLPDSLVYDPQRDPKRLLYNMGLYATSIVISFGVLWAMPESVSNWDKDEMREEGLGAKWEKNVQSGPVIDEDGAVLNYVIHPWFGAIYYMSARGSGFKAWESFAFSAFMSTVFWEYGTEAFAEVPSWQDLIVTPVIGSVLGEGFFVWKGRIIRNDSRLLKSRFLGRFTMFLMDPFNAIINGMGYKTKNKVKATSAFVPIGYDKNSNRALWGMYVVVNF